MNDGLFLVARVAADSLGETLEWLGSDEPPFQPMDPLDFQSSAEVVAIYDLYRTQYLEQRQAGTPDSVVSSWMPLAGRLAQQARHRRKRTTPPSEQRRPCRRRTSTLSHAREVLLWGSTLRRRSTSATKTHAFARDKIVERLRFRSFQQGARPAG